MHILHLMQVWLVMALVSYSSGARILALTPFAFKSHQIFFQSVLKELARKGHQVVAYSPFPQENPVPNYTDVLVNSSLSDSFVDYNLLLESFQASKIAAITEMWKFLTIFEEQALNHENIQLLAKSEEKFDLVITEAFLNQEAFLAFGHKFNAPTIAIQSIFSFNIVDRVMGNDLALSYIPDFSFEMSDKLSFWERLINFYSTVKVMHSFYNKHIPNQQVMIDSYLKFQDAPQLTDMLQNISLVLFNQHPTIYYPRPFPPNFIPLGGIHLPTNKTPLSKDIERFMTEAKNGVIYFSLGTVVPDNSLPEEFYTNFINVFAKLNQRVLWKTKRSNISEVPDNVKIVKWAPQQAVLAHPNCVLFITHGGLLSQLEVIHSGVPVVAIPFFGDQPLNVRYYEEKGIGVKLDFLSLSQDSISTAINTVLKNPKYKDNVLGLKKLFDDLPMSQSETAVFWVEHVLRHGGGSHLRPASALMPWYQLTLLDVLAVLLLAVVSIITTLSWLCCRITSKYHNSKKKDFSNKKNN